MTKTSHPDPEAETEPRASIPSIGADERKTDLELLQEAQEEIAELNDKLTAAETSVRNLSAQVSALTTEGDLARACLTTARASLAANQPSGGNKAPQPMAAVSTSKPANLSGMAKAIAHLSQNQPEHQN